MTVAKKAAGVKKVVVAAVTSAPKVAFEIADAYREIPNGDGVMRAEPGDYIVQAGDMTLVMPPERFAEAYPELVD